MSKRLLSTLLGLLLLVPAYCDARNRKHKKLFPETKDHQLKYEYIGSLNDGRMRVLDFKGKYGYIDSSLKEVIPCIYDHASIFCDGISLVEKDKKYGIIDTAGNKIVPCEYDEIISVEESRADFRTPFGCTIDGYLLVRKDTIKAIYDLKNKQTVEIAYEVGRSDQYYPNNNYRLVWLGRKCGLAYKNGPIALPIKYERISSMHEGYLCIRYNKKWGFLDSNLREITSCIYDSARNFSNGLAAIKKDGKWGYINQKGQEIITPQFDQTQDFTAGVAPVVVNGKYGLINRTGTQKIACIYEEIQPITKPRTLIIKRGDKCAISDSNGHLLTNFAYDRANNYSGTYIVYRNRLLGLVSENFADTTPIKYNEIGYQAEEGYFTLKIGDKWGVLDSTFKEVIPFKFRLELEVDDSLRKAHHKSYYPASEDHVAGVYLFADNFVNGLARVKNDLGKWGYINKKGQESIACAYDYAWNFEQGKALVYKGNEQGVINKKGKLIEPFTAKGYRYYKGLRVIEKDGKRGFVNKRGKVVAPAIYSEITIFTRNMILVKKDSLYGYINAKGKVKIPVMYNIPAFFNNGVVPMLKDHRWAILNKRGRIVARPDSSISISGYNFSGGLIKVQNESGNYGYMNKKGKITIPCIFKEAEDFYSGGAVVSIFDSSKINTNEVVRVGIINKKGHWIVPCRYEWIEVYSKRGLINVRNDLNAKHAYINSRSKLVTPYMFDPIIGDATISTGKIIRVRQNGRWKYINRKGVVLFQFKARYCAGEWDGNDT